MEQLGAFRGDRHPLAVPLSIAYVAVVPTDREPFNKGTWIQVEPSAGPSGRQRLMLERALQRVRDQMDFVPIAFWFLPTSFTLSALQQTYELLLGQRVHKASFRRTLLVADLVEPLNDWQSDGPGRPAQLFRYAPGTGRAAHRGVRFDLLG